MENSRNAIIKSTTSAAINLPKRSKGFVREFFTRQEINSHFDKTFPSLYFFFSFVTELLFFCFVYWVSKLFSCSGKFCWKFLNALKSWKFVVINRKWIVVNIVFWGKEVVKKDSRSFVLSSFKALKVLRRRTSLISSKSTFLIFIYWYIFIIIIITIIIIIFFKAHLSVKALWIATKT